MNNNSSIDNRYYQICHNTAYNLFYKNLNSFRLSPISDERIEAIKLLAKMERLNFLTNPRIKLAQTKKLLKLMEKLATRPENYNITENEKYLFYMFAVDPTFEAYIIAATAGDASKIKSRMLAKFGLNDVNLIRLERKFVNLKMLSDNREKLEDEIDKRALK